MPSVAQAAFFVALALAATRAQAAPPDAELCAASYESAQRLRGASRLREAEQQALACANDACPRVLRQECARWVDEIRHATPTLLIHATGSDGCDLVDAQISIDGVAVGERQGSALPIDPGVHTVRAESPGAKAREQRIVVVQGDRDRRIDLGAPQSGTVCAAWGDGAPRAARAPSTGDLPAEIPRNRATPTLVYVLGGIGIASVATGSVVGITGFMKRSDLDGCSPRCNPDDVGAMHRTFVVSDILIGVGVATLAAATYLYVSRPAHPLAARYEAPALGTFRF